MYFPILFMVGVMSLATLFTEGLFILILPVIVLLLPLLVRKERSGLCYVSVYLATALAVFYSSINIYVLSLLVLYAFVLVKTYKPLEMLANRRFSSIGVVGPSAVLLLKLVLIFSLAVLINYRIILSIGILTLVILVYTMFKYVDLHNVSISMIEYPKKIYMGDDLEIRIRINSPRETWTQLSYLNKARWLKASGEHVLRLRISPSTLGRHQFILRIYVYDSELFARRLVLEKPIVFYVVPSFTRPLEYARSKILGRVEVKEILEPVETKIYILGKKEAGLVKAVGGESLETVLGSLPYLIRSILKGFITRTLEFASLPGNEWGGESGARKAVLGDYHGVRWYLPGDRLKDIHWKKTISRRILVIKEYTSSGVEKVASLTGRYGPVIVVDLLASSLRELDNVLRQFMRFLVVSSMKTPFAKIAVFLVAGDIMVLMQEKVVNVLNRVSEELPRIMPRIIYDYESFGRSLPSRIVKELLTTRERSLLIRLITEPNIVYARKFMELLVQNNILPPRNIVIIHGSVSSAKYSFLKHYLEENGYRVTCLSDEEINVTERDR